MSRRERTRARVSRKPEPRTPAPEPPIRPSSPNHRQGSPAPNRAAERGSPEEPAQGDSRRFEPGSRPWSSTGHQFNPIQGTAAERVPPRDRTRPSRSAPFQGWLPDRATIRTIPRRQTPAGAHDREPVRRDSGAPRRHRAIGLRRPSKTWVAIAGGQTSSPGDSAAGRLDRPGYLSDGAAIQLASVPMRPSKPFHPGVRYSEGQSPQSRANDQDQEERQEKQPAFTGAQILISLQQAHRRRTGTPWRVIESGETASNSGLPGSIAQDILGRFYFSKLDGFNDTQIFIQSMKPGEMVAFNSIGKSQLPQVNIKKPQERS